MKKSVLFILSIGLSSQAFAKGENNDIFLSCEKTTLTKLLENIKEKNEFVSENPFSNNCVSFIVDKIDNPLFNNNNFHIKQLYETYSGLINNTENTVINLIDDKNKRLYQFFRISQEDFFVKNMKKSWTKNNEFMEMNFDEFLKLHELFHLDFEQQKDLNRKQKESLADISSVILISLQQNLNVKQTVEFLNTIKELRNKDKIRGYDHPLSGKIYDDEHLDKNMFNKIIKKLEQEDLELPLRDTILFNEIKDIDISKKINNIYKR